jgi:anti-anti-sigma factor
MKYSIDKKEDYCIFKLQEEKLDGTIGPALKSDFVTFNAEGIRNFIIDMSDVKYTDSSGLSALLVGNRIFSEDEGIFVIANLSDHVMKLIKISQLNNVLNIVPSVEEAVDMVFLNKIEGELGSEQEDQ